MKKIVSLLSLLLFFTVALKAQTTISIPDTNVTANTVVLLPVNSGSLEVYSLTMHISYDTSVLQYQAIQNNPFESVGVYTANIDSTNGVIAIAWFSTTKVTITDKLFDLQFLYKGGTSTVGFTGTNELTDINSTPFNITFVDGSVSIVTDVEDIGSKIPDSYELNQNYPNPFNPSTTINFALKVSSQVSINIYNSLGQRVTNLVNGSFSAGFKSVQFNASNLASGLYFYRIIATGVDGSKFIQAKKMILMK
ncbi:MAG TPA: T9SS type A sorting domain-containing protein [Ignavibacteria bacterium]|nr:T9SS type A sorting domain-containing protein [Ignavibacteria bacterium]